MKLNLLIILTFLLFACDLEETFFTPLDEVEVHINYPEDYQNVFPGDEVYFNGKVRARSSSDLTGLKAQWISDKDGLIFEESINEDGETTFSTSELSVNIHKIKLNIINEVNSAIYDSTEIYNAVKLSVEKFDNYSNIKWYSLDDIYFESFELYRSRFKHKVLSKKPIFITKNIQDTIFRDTTAIIGENHFYQVILKRSSQMPNKFESNIDSIQPGRFIKTDYPLLKVIVDSKRNYAYGMVATQSYIVNKTGYGLIFLNLKDFSVENRILKDVRFSDMVMDPTETYLYLASRGKTIHKVNLNNKSLESTFEVSRDAYKIGIGNNGKLYYHITQPTMGDTQFRIYDLDNNKNIPFSTGDPDAYSSFSYGNFVIDHNNVIYHGGSEMSKIGTANDIFKIIDQWDSDDTLSKIVVLNNNKLYWNHYMLDLNLNVLGTFKNEFYDESVEDVSPNGKIVLGSGNLFKSADQSIIKAVPAYYYDGVFVNDTRILVFRSENPYSEIFETTISLYDLNY